MGYCGIHNWRGPYGHECPDCIAERNHNRRHEEQLQALQAQSEQYFSLQLQQQQLLELEKQRVQLEFERDVSPEEAFEKGNKFDPNECYRLSPNGELIVERVNPYLRLPLKEAFEKGVIEYRNRKFPSDPGREYVLEKAKEYPSNPNPDWLIKFTTNEGIDFNLSIKPSCSGSLPDGFDTVEIVGQGELPNIVIRSADGELIFDSFRLVFDDHEIGSAYFEGGEEFLLSINDFEQKAKRLEVMKSHNVNKVIYEQKQQEEFQSVIAAEKLELKRIQSRQSIVQVCTLLFSIGFFGTPIVWFFGGNKLENYWSFGLPAMGIAIVLYGVAIHLDGDPRKH